MEYHSDRFVDFSFMIFNKDKLLALLPANKVGTVVYSHQGLTYGGLIVPFGISTTKVLSIFKLVTKFLESQGFSKFFIKQIPDFYCLEPANEMAYSLGKRGFLVERQMVLAIDYFKPLNIHKTKIKHFNKPKSNNFLIKEDDALDHFWNEVLEPRLMERHNVKPVHSLREIKNLKDKFPDKIIQYNIFHDEKIVAGITIFDKGAVVKSQYGATTSYGEKLRALEYLFVFLIRKFKDENKKYFSMGTVTDINKGGYNEGLLVQKQELGCQVYLQDLYCINL